MTVLIEMDSHQSPINIAPQSARPAGPPPLRPAETSKSYYWFLVIYLVILSAMGSFVNDMYTPSLPEMSRYFHTTRSAVQLSLTLGMVGLGLGQILLGPISDRYGRKPVLVASAGVLVAGCAASVFSRSMEAFLFCRLVQGFGASGGYFLARTIPADIFHGRQLAKFMSVVGAVNGIAPASAPVIGGITADHFHWQGVFVLIGIFTIVALIMSIWLKESLYPSQRSSIAWWRSFPGYAELLKRRRFMIHTGLKGISLGLLFAYISSAPFILEEHFGFSQTSYGLIIGANSLGVAAGSMLSLLFKPYKKALIAAAIIMAPAVLVNAMGLWLWRSFWVYEICCVLMLIADGMIFSASNTLAMNEGRDKAGEASAILGVSGYVVGAIVAPLVGLGDVFHSTAMVFTILMILIVLFCIWSSRLPADLVTARQHAATQAQK